MHFEFNKLINFPYFLLKSLEKMSSSVQKISEDQVGYKLCHYGLIKILISEESKNKGFTQEIFLDINQSGGVTKVISIKS